MINMMRFGTCRPFYERAFDFIYTRLVVAEEIRLGLARSILSPAVIIPFTVLP